MSVHAHQPPAIKVGTPPNTPRRCIATPNCRILRDYDPRSKADWTVEDRRCHNGASPWLPEADYCATHAPADAVPLMKARQALYDAICHDVWAQVLAELPYHHAD